MGSGLEVSSLSPSEQEMRPSHSVTVFHSRIPASSGQQEAATEDRSSPQIPWLRNGETDVGISSSPAAALKGSLALREHTPCSLT